MNRSPEKPRENGLSNWRKRTAEEKQKQMIELAKLRENAQTITRDGREFVVVTIPDKYAWWSES